MKKTIIKIFVLMLLVTVICCLSFDGKVLADETDKIVKTSELISGAVLEIESTNTTLIVDKDITLRKICGYGINELTILDSGNHTLKVYNPNGDAINLYKLTIDANVNAVGSKNGVFICENSSYADGYLKINGGNCSFVGKERGATISRSDVEINGGNVSFYCSSEEALGFNCGGNGNKVEINKNAKVNISAQGRHATAMAIYCPLYVNGGTLECYVLNASQEYENTFHFDDYAIFCNSFVNVTDNGKIVAKNLNGTEDSMYLFNASGNVLKSSCVSGIYCNELNVEGEVEATGIYSKKDVKIDGKTKIENTGYGVFAYDGNISLKGDVDIKTKVTSKYAYLISSICSKRGKIDLFGNVNIYAEDQCGIVAYDREYDTRCDVDINVSGNVKIITTNGHICIDTAGQLHLVDGIFEIDSDYDKEINMMRVYRGVTSDKLLSLVIPSGGKLEGEKVVTADGKDTKHVKIVALDAKAYIEGEGYEDETLELVMSDFPDNYNIDWQISEDIGITWTNINDAHDTTYTIKEGQAQSYIRASIKVDGYFGEINTEKIRIKNTYTVNFDLNGHGYGAPKPQRVRLNEKATDPGYTMLDYKGKKFDGWYSEKECKYRHFFEQHKIYYDKTLYAKWIDVPYTVSFDNNGGKGSMTSVRVLYGDSYMLPECSFIAPGGKRFLSWNVEPALYSTYYPGNKTTITGNTTIKANWTYIKATFDSNGGGKNPSGLYKQAVSVNDKSELTLPDCDFIAPDNMQFDAWDLSELGKDKGNPGEVVKPDKDVTIKALWKPIQCEISFLKQSGSGTMDKVSVDKGSLYKIPECTYTPPEQREFNNYIYQGKTYYPGQSIYVYSDITFSVNWKYKDDATWTISFNSGEGSGSMPDINVKHGEAYTLPECTFTPPVSDNPENPYYFYYWKNPSNYTLYYPGDNTSATANKEWKAIWKNDYVNITFNTDGHGQNPEPQKLRKYIASDVTVEPKVPEEEGYKFEYWYYVYGHEFEFGKHENEDYELRAYWTPIDYNISGATDGNGTIDFRNIKYVVNTDKGNIGDQIRVIPKPNNGYEVDTIIYIPEDGEPIDITEDKLFTMPAKDVEVKVTFRKKMYSVSCSEVIGGSVTTSENMAYAGTSIYVTAKPNAGYELESVKYSEYTNPGDVTDITEAGYLVMPYDDIYVSATFKEIPVVTYNIEVTSDENGTASASASSGTTGTEITLTVTPKEGYKLSGWIIISGGVNVVDNKFTIKSDDVKIKAVFEKITYKATFDSNGGSDVDYQFIKIGDKVIKPVDPTREGYTFDCWCTDSELNNAYIFDTAVYSEITLFARWNEIPKPTYTVTVSDDGNGTATASLVSGIEGTSVTLTATPKEGYKFREWQVVSGGVSISDNKFDIGTEDVVIKAIFEKIEQPTPTPTASTTPNGSPTPEIIPTSEVSPTPDTSATPEISPTPVPTSGKFADNVISPEKPVKVADIKKTILNIKDEKDTKGSTFTLLKAKGTPKSKKSIKLSWAKVPGAEKYMIYGNKCGKKNKYKYITTVTGTSYTAKKLKKGTYYKYTIVAVKGDEALATSKTIHVVTDGGKKGNNTKVKLSKTKLTLAKGKSKTIKAKLKSKKKVSIHRKVAWESDNVSVAKVNSKGKITAVGKGTCYVYAYAQNGVAAKIKITVK